MPEPAAPKGAPLSFETGLQQLEAIVKEMESGELPLERALELFERGMKLSDACRKQLEEAETRVEVLMKRAGEVHPEPLRSNKALRSPNTWRRSRRLSTRRSTAGSAEHRTRPHPSRHAL